MKTCSRCNQEKPKSEFYSKSAQCKECVRAKVSKRRSEHRDKINAQKRENYKKNPARYREATREWRRKNPDRKRETARKHREKYRDRLRIKDACWRYKITPDDLNALIKKQKGRCAICGATTTGKRGLHVDHCHETGMVRGILCGRCNASIGMLGDRFDLVKKAYRYLLRFRRRLYRELLA